jgi:hypothetical protein
MAIVEFLIMIVHAQRVMILTRTVTLDLSAMSQYRAGIQIQFIDGVKMAKKRKFVDMSLTTDGLCLTTRIFSICSTATSMSRHVGVSR